MQKIVQYRGFLKFSNISILPKRLCSKSLNNDELVLKEFVNRNPRSMELLRLARKPLGFCLDSPSITYYYRLCLERNVNNLTGYVVHNNGRRVVEASTKEWAIRKHLYSAIDASAAQNLGRIIARRCMQAGIYEMQTNLTSNVETSERINLFIEAMKEGGITLGEAPQIREKETYTFIHKSPTFPWEVTEEEVDSLDLRNANSPKAETAEVEAKKSTSKKSKKQKDSSK